MNNLILFLVNHISHTSIPVEVANNIMNDQFKVIILSLYDNETEALNKAKEMGIEKKVIGFGLKNKLNIRKLFDLYSSIKDLNPDIIHLHHTYSGFWGRLIGYKLNNTKVVTTIHNDMRFFNKYQKITRGLTLNFSDRIVCNSNNTKKSFLGWQKKLIDEGKKLTIYNGIDVQKIFSQRNNNIKKEFSVSEEEFLIGNTAMLIEQKDQKTLIEAYKRFHEKVPDSKLLIVGDGKLRSDLESLTRKLDIEENIIFTGLVARSKVFKIINSLDLFVMSSIYEGFCNAMVEAMVAENPVIATDVPPLPEVAGEDNALFFEKKNSDELAQKMLRLYENEAERSDLAEKARAYAVENYSLENCVNEYEKLYKELIDERE